MRKRSTRRTLTGLLALGLVATGVAPFVAERPQGRSLLPPLAAQTKPASKTEESWQVIYIGDQRIGYGHVVVRQVEEQGRTLIRTANESEMTIKRFGQTLKMNTSLQTNETEDGQLLSFVMEVHNPPANSTRTVGRIEGDRLRLETTVAGSAQKSTLNWDKAVKSPAYQDRMLRNPPLKPGESRSFKTFLPELNKVATVKVTADEQRPVKLLDGKERTLLKTRITQSILPGMTIRAYLDEQGESVMSEMDFLGATMTTYTVSKETALEAISGAELDLAVNTLVRVTPLKNGHRTRTAVYRITTPDEDPAEFLVEGPTQKVKKVGPDAAELTVTTVATPASSKVVRTDAEYLEATRYLQSRDPQVVDHARKAAAGETDQVKVAFNMERYVYEKLEKKNFSTALASAGEVAKSLEGDCTEHAVLLAAMLRAAKIPSRIAVGLVYIESHSSFGGHMWTEAFLGGQWVPLDATLGRGGIGAAHIKLAESSFADEAAAPVATFLPLLKILGKMKIEVVQADP